MLSAVANGMGGPEGMKLNMDKPSGSEIPDSDVNMETLMKASLVKPPTPAILDGAPTTPTAPVAETSADLRSRVGKRLSLAFFLFSQFGQ